MEDSEDIPMEDKKVIVIGAPGVGKTLVIQKMIEYLGGGLNAQPVITHEYEGLNIYMPVKLPNEVDSLPIGVYNDEKPDFKFPLDKRLPEDVTITFWEMDESHLASDNGLLLGANAVLVILDATTGAIDVKKTYKNYHWQLPKIIGIANSAIKYTVNKGDLLTRHELFVFPTMPVSALQNRNMMLPLLRVLHALGMVKGEV